MSQTSRKQQLYLYGTVVAMGIAVAIRFATLDSGGVVVPHDTIPVAQKRLENLRRKAATVPGKEVVLKQVTAELAEREKGIVLAETSEQVRAHLMDVLQKTARANGFDTQGAAQLPEPKPLGKDYGAEAVGQTFTCGIDQLVNFLSAIANEPEILATDSIFIQPVRNKNKDIQVRLILSGVMPKKLIPVKKGDSF